MGFQDILSRTVTAQIGVLILGVFCGALMAGLVLALVAHIYSVRMYRWRVFDEVRRELRGPILAYVEWLHSVSAEFSAWKGDLLKRFSAREARDQYELNRIRRLFVDARGQQWFNRLDEYREVLGPFKITVGKLWGNQVQIQEQFHAVFRLLESDPQGASLAGKTLEEISFAQSRAMSEFLRELQHECLKTLAQSRPLSRKSILKSNVIAEEETRSMPVFIPAPEPVRV